VLAAVPLPVLEHRLEHQRHRRTLHAVGLVVPAVFMPVDASALVVVADVHPARVADRGPNGRRCPVHQHGDLAVIELADRAGRVVDGQVDAEIPHLAHHLLGLDLLAVVGAELVEHPSDVGALLHLSTEPVDEAVADVVGLEREDRADHVLEGVVGEVVTHRRQRFGAVDQELDAVFASGLDARHGLHVREVRGPVAALHGVVFVGEGADGRVFFAGHRHHQGAVANSGVEVIELARVFGGAEQSNDGLLVGAEGRGQAVVLGHRTIAEEAVGDGVDGRAERHHQLPQHVGSFGQAHLGDRLFGEAVLSAAELERVEEGARVGPPNRRRRLGATLAARQSLGVGEGERLGRRALHDRQFGLGDDRGALGDRGGRREWGQVH
jgi:hypothetical protein